MNYQIKPILAGLLVLGAVAPIFLWPRPLFGAQASETSKQKNESLARLADAAERRIVPGMLPRGQRREFLAEMLQSRNVVISS